ncbi:MAG TPA: GNAT family N-acetyltransferase [Vicinamibacterales bacterium]|nr:GNAT family N-acetyltransferase [Vicinamibacterales bacterium]
MRRVFVAAGQTAWNHILPAGTLADLSAPDRWHPGHGGDVLVAERAGDIVGFVCLRPSQDEDAGAATAEVDAFYTHPSVWGMGVGRALLTEAVARLAASGFREATLWTERRNERPLRFYHAAGWKLDGTERRRTFRGIELVELRHRVTIA